MDSELQTRAPSQDVELPEACVACDGPVVARFTPAGALAVCLKCHTITRLGIVRDGDDLHVGHLPRAFA